MAYGEFRGAMGAEAYYGGPRETVDAAKVEATKKASYLSSMDQFYAQLSEMERQFDITAGLKREQFEFETGERFDWEKEMAATGFELQEQDISMRERVGLAGPKAATEAAKYQYKFGMEELKWKEEESERTQEFLEGYFRDYGGGEVGVTGEGQSTEDWLLQQSREKEAGELGIDYLELY